MPRCLCPSDASPGGTEANILVPRRLRSELPRVSVKGTLSTYAPNGPAQGGGTLEQDPITMLGSRIAIGDAKKSQGDADHGAQPPVWYPPSKGFRKRGSATPRNNIVAEGRALQTVVVCSTFAPENRLALSLSW